MMTSVDSLHKESAMLSFDVSTDVKLNKLLNNSRIACDSRRPDGHVTLMI